MDMEYGAECKANIKDDDTGAKSIKSNNIEPSKQDGETFYDQFC
jgi:hypothetical protein